MCPVSDIIFGHRSKSSESHRNGPLPHVLPPHFPITMIVGIGIYRPKLQRSRLERGTPLKSEKLRFWIDFVQMSGTNWHKNAMTHTAAPAHLSIFDARASHFPFASVPCTPFDATLNLPQVLYVDKNLTFFAIPPYPWYFQGHRIIEKSQ